MEYTLSQQSADKLRALFADVPGGGTDHVVGRGGGRAVGFVSISEPAAAGAGVICHYDAVDGAWVEYDSCMVIEASGEILSSGYRYLGIRYGWSAGLEQWVYVVDRGGKLGCELWIDRDDEGKLKTDYTQVVGYGLTTRDKENNC